MHRVLALLTTQYENANTKQVTQRKVTICMCRGKREMSTVQQNHNELYSVIKSQNQARCRVKGESRNHSVQSEGMCETLAKSGFANL